MKQEAVGSKLNNKYLRAECCRSGLAERFRGDIVSKKLSLRRVVRKYDNDWS